MKKTGEQAGDFVLLGKITKPHGVRGEVKVFPFTETPEGLKKYKTFFLSADDGRSHTAYTVKKVRCQGKMLIADLGECCNRNQAEEIVGLGVWVAAEDLPALEDGEFYFYTLEGKRAVTDEGQELGNIAAVLTGNGQDLLSIQKAGREYLVPFVAEFVVRQEEDCVVLALPPGLLDINQ